MSINGGGGGRGRRRTTEGVPDAGNPGPVGDEPSPYEDVFGVEAAVPARDYGPPIPSRLPEERVTREVREIERRVNAHLSPVFPLSPRRKPQLEWVWKRYRRFAMRNRATAVDDFGRDPVYVQRMEPLLDFLCRHYFAVDVDGIEHIPRAGGALLVANHAGPTAWDAAVLLHSVRQLHPQQREVRPLVDDMLFHFPYIGVFINRIGGVRACADNAARLLERQALVAVFPEGIRSSGRDTDEHRVQPFGRGFVRLALRSGVPVIPIGVVCLASRSGRPRFLDSFASSVVGALPRPGKWRVRVGEPIDFSASHGADASADADLCSDLAQRVRGRVQELVNLGLDPSHSDDLG